MSMLLSCPFINCDNTEAQIWLQRNWLQFFILPGQRFWLNFPSFSVFLAIAFDTISSRSVRVTVTDSLSITTPKYFMRLEGLRADSLGCTMIPVCRNMRRVSITFDTQSHCHCPISIESSRKDVEVWPFFLNAAKIGFIGKLAWCQRQAVGWGIELINLTFLFKSQELLVISVNWDRIVCIFEINWCKAAILPDHLRCNILSWNGDKLPFGLGFSNLKSSFQSHLPYYAL